MMTIDQARQTFIAARARGVADETTAALLADAVIERANPLKLRLELLRSDLADRQVLRLPTKYVQEQIAIAEGMLASAAS